MRLRVCLIQAVMKQYRIPFFLRLSERLSKAGVDLQVVYGTPWPQEALRNDHGDIPPPLGLKVPSRMLGGKLFWMPVFRPWVTADLVVVEHANKHVLNFILATLHRLRIKRLAYWGHGRDLQAAASSPGERYKRRSLHWADWWFAYTRGSARYVAEQGFERRRITVVNNAIDTAELRVQLMHVSEEMRAALRARFAWPTHSRVAVYCGSLYPSKRLDWLMYASTLVQERHPSFRLIVIGDGDLRSAIQAFAQNNHWVHWAGAVFGNEKAELLSLAELWLNPGLVGLGILDAFCARLPLLTTMSSGHGPEIEYLEHGRNGLMVASDPDEFAQSILDLLENQPRLAAMRAAAGDDGMSYSIEAMAENFAAGVKQCLGQW
jgi:glycosyltransferase involved in cell wall biosynthesis